jgi:hypothetical protein
VSTCSPLQLKRLQKHIKENNVLSVANARFASKVFGALFEWVLCILAASCGRAVIHCATSSDMINLLATSSPSSNEKRSMFTMFTPLQVDICDEVLTLREMIFIIVHTIK